MPVDPKPTGRVRDQEYLRKVKTLVCCVRADWRARFPRPSDCEGVTEAAHVGQRGKGRKCDDREAIPLCGKHHRMLDQALGGSLFAGRYATVEGVTVFVGLSGTNLKVARRLWLDEQIGRTQTEMRQREEMDLVLAREGIPF